MKRQRTIYLLLTAAMVASLLVRVLPAVPVYASISHDSDLLQITVGEKSSSGWDYQYDPVNDPGNFIRSVFSERYYADTDAWPGVIQSSSFTIDTPFDSAEDPDTATLHYGDLRLTRHVDPPVGSDRSFSITFELTNTGQSTLENVRFLQGIDYDISDAGGDYAWYNEATDTIWQNDDDYFKNGFRGSRPSSHHDCNHYSSMWNDLSSGELNDLTSIRRPQVKQRIAVLHCSGMRGTWPHKSPGT